MDAGSTALLFKGPGRLESMTLTGGLEAEMDTVAHGVGCRNE